MGDDLAAEIAEHERVEADVGVLYCFKCDEPWPCLVRRLADENQKLRAAIDAVLKKSLIFWAELAEAPEREG